MNTKIILLLEITLLLYLSNTVLAEGCRELMAGSCSNICYIVIWDNNVSTSDFATYNCPVADRLNIRVKSGDKIYFGYYDSNGDVYYQLKNPNGTVVMGPTLVKSTSASGWISSCAKAITGPSNLYAGGYTPLSYTTTMSGDYYIEFAVNNSATTYSKRLLYFDITVVSGGKEAKGRIWSEKWDLNTNSSTNPFMGNLYIYTNDSVVTKVEGNSGMQPYGFTASSNSTGASNVGSITQMRKSDYTLDIESNGGTPSNPQYAIFVNDPDSTIFPTGSVGTIKSITLSECGSSSNCIMVDVTQAGYVDLTLTFSNGTSVQLATTNVVAGENCISWNGLDGNGNTVSDAEAIQINVTYERGLTNLPYGDVENNLDGIMVALVRPTHDANGNALSAPLMFWDDSLLDDPANNIDGESNLSGCTGGCHTWQNMGADNSNLQIINTWWYITQQVTSTTEGCPVVLPLTLINFTGEDSEHIVSLHWTMATAAGLNHFEIERSLNGTDFIKIGAQNAPGYGGQYHFNDTSVLSVNGTVYYRLKMVDNNSNDTYSSVIFVNLNSGFSNAITVFPNPNKGNNFSVGINGIAGSQINIKLFNIDGRMAALLPITTTGTNEISSQVNLPEQLEPGFYIVECDGENGVLTSHMIVY
jgi:hypothetical protein